MIRLAQREDAESIDRLLNQLGYPSETDRIAAALAKQNEVYVYERSQQIIGFVSTIQFFYFPTLQHATRITAICIDRSQRNLGIGGELIHFIEQLANNRGDRFIELTCAFDRESAHQFYLKNGYSKHSYKFVKSLTYHD